MVLWPWWVLCLWCRSGLDKDRKKESRPGFLASRKDSRTKVVLARKLEKQGLGSSPALVGLVSLVCLVALVGLMALVGLVALMGLVGPEQC